MPLFLDLRKDKNGLQVDVSWQTGGLLLGEYMMHSFGEYPSEEKESRLSQILEDRPHPKYCLSARACQGILNRANRRGKKLPDILQEALEQQITRSKLGGAQNGIVTENCNWDGEQTSPTLTSNNAGGSQRMPDKDNFNCVLSYGIDRAAFNQGVNAQYNIQIEEEKIVTCVSKGPGAYVQETIK